MNHSLRLCLALTVLGFVGCQKKAEPAAAPSQTPPSQPAAPTTTSNETPASAPSSAESAPSTPSVAGELPIIAKARAFLGTDAALDRVHSIHFVGSLVTTDPKDPKKLTRADMEIIFQKPYQQRVTAVNDKTIETTALDDYEAWSRVTLRSDPTKWQQTLLGSDGVKHLRAQAWENLAFFRGIEHEGGSVKDMGPATVGGIACEKVAFIHAPNIIFYRFFDTATGRLVYSENEGGGTIREEGEMHADGVRFPKTIITVAKNQNGAAQTITITFDKITLNENFPDSVFAVPPLEAGH